MDFAHVMMYACGGGKCGIINNKYIIHVSGIENQVFGINKVFNVSFFSVFVGISRPQFRRLGSQWPRPCLVGIFGSGK